MNIPIFCRQFVRIFALIVRPLWFSLWVRPAAATHFTGTAADLLRSKPDLLIENDLLRHQLVVLRRSAKRPVLTCTDHTLLVLLAGRLRSWRHALSSSPTHSCAGIARASACSGSGHHGRSSDVRRSRRRRSP